MIIVKNLTVTTSKNGEVIVTIMKILMEIMLMTVLIITTMFNKMIITNIVSTKWLLLNMMMIISLSWK